MEMEFKDTGRRRRFLLIFVGVALALAAGFGAFSLSSKSGAAPVVETKDVLVAARDITARTPVTADDLTVRKVPVDEALSQAYSEQVSVIGRVTSVPIYADQQITPNLFATSSADADFSILGPDDVVAADSPDWRAVAIRISSDRAVGGDIKAGDHVDLFVSTEIKVFTLTPEGNYVQTDTANAEGFQSGQSTKITFQDLEVLKATPDDDLYVFKVNLHQAEQIAHVVQEAPDSFTVALRPSEDTRDVDMSQYGTTTDRLVITYLFPAPQLVDLGQLLGPSPYPYPGADQIPGRGGPSNGSPAPGGAPGPSPTPSASTDPNASPTPSESPSPTP